MPRAAAVAGLGQRGQPTRGNRGPRAPLGQRDTAAGPATQVRLRGSTPGTRRAGPGRPGARRRGRARAQAWSLSGPGGPGRRRLRTRPVCGRGGRRDAIARGRRRGISRSALGCVRYVRLSRASVTVWEKRSGGGSRHRITREGGVKEEGEDVLRQRRPGELAGEETARGGEELTAWRGDVLALAARGEEDVWVRKRGRRRKQARSDVLYERPLVRRPLRDEGAQGRAEKMDGYFWDGHVSELPFGMRSTLRAPRQRGSAGKADECGPGPA